MFVCTYGCMCVYIYIYAKQCDRHLKMTNGDTKDETSLCFDGGGGRKVESKAS